MIRLTRDLSKAAKRFTIPTRRSDNLKLFRDGLAGAAKPDSAVWKAAKPQLKAESFGKCAYCEAPTSTVAHGDVEHFRPKDIYWWLAYCYFNYAYGCQVCNQSNKGTKFPLKTGGAPIAPPAKPTPLDDTTIAALIDAVVPNPLEAPGAALIAFRKAIADEGGLLVDPYEDTPETFFRYSVKTGTKEVHIAPAATTGKPLLRSNATIDVLGLNREELVGHRYKIYSTLELARVVFASTDPATKKLAEDLLRDAMSPDSDHSGMARYFVLKKWKLPIAPPP
jgi:hypothetical protein